MASHRYQISQGPRREIIVGGRDWQGSGRRSVNQDFIPIFRDFQLALLDQPMTTLRDSKAIYKYAKKYFEALAWPDLKGNSNFWWKDMTDEQLMEFLTELFVAADDDNSGALDIDEFQNVMASLQLTSEQIELIWKVNVCDNGDDETKSEVAGQEQHLPSDLALSLSSDLGTRAHLIVCLLSFPDPDLMIECAHARGATRGRAEAGSRRRWQRDSRVRGVPASDGADAQDDNSDAGDQGGGGAHF